jgi:hypothetical protein
MMKNVLNGKAKINQEKIPIYAIPVNGKGSTEEEFQMIKSSSVNGHYIPINLQNS